MTRPVTIPPPGSPLVGLSPLLSDLAAAANSDDMPAAGLFGRAGTASTNGPRASLALFELTGPFVAGSSPWANAPNTTWHCAPATRVEYYPTPAEWATPDEESDSTPPDTTHVYAPTSFLYSGSPGAGSVSGKAPGMPAGARLWCYFDESAYVWVAIAPGTTSTSPPQLTAFELYDDITPGAIDKYAWTLNNDYSRNTGAGHTTKVSDQILGDVRAYGSDHTGWTTTRGAMGLFIQGANGKNQIVSIKRLAKLISVTAPATCTSGNFTVTACTPEDDGQNPCSDGASITVSTDFVLRGPATLQCRLSGVDTDYVVVSAPRSAQLAAVITGTVPGNTAAGATFTAAAPTALGDGFAPDTAAVINWNQQTCADSPFTAILVSASCTPTYLLIDADCPPSGGCPS